MIKEFLARLQQGYRTYPYPQTMPVLPERYRGKPEIQAARCPENCGQCQDVCPTEALRLVAGKPQLDLGRCLFCGECAKVCPAAALQFSREFRLAVRERQHLEYSGTELQLAQALDRKMLKIFGRSLKLRQVSAAGCNACEADSNVLGTLVYDLGRFGIQFVASPRHADGLLITGPVSKNMELAVKKTYEALPAPKLVIAVGACAISGGPFRDHPEVCNGVTGIVPVDLFVPGCPPHPWTILDGLLRLLDRLPAKSKRS